MNQRCAILLAVWALVVVPNLCRAGLLTACCHDAGAPDAPAAADANACCTASACESAAVGDLSTFSADANQPQRQPHRSSERECESCLTVCGAAAKPAGASDAASYVQAPCACAAMMSLPDAALAVTSFTESPPAPESGGLPFPASDRPLRI